MGFVPGSETPLKDFKQGDNVMVFALLCRAVFSSSLIMTDSEKHISHCSLIKNTYTHTCINNFFEKCLALPSVMHSIIFCSVWYF